MSQSLKNRISQLEVLNSLEREKSSSKEFLFPEDSELRKRRKSADYNTSEVQSEDDENYPFESYVTIEFSKEVKKFTLNWIIDKIRKRKSENGAQLTVRKEPEISKDKGLIIHISASRIRLLELADEIGFTKQTRHGMRSFNIACLDDFIYRDNMDVDEILTPADRQLIVKHALDNIKADKDEKFIPGYQVPLYHGQSIIYALLTEELIVNMLSLHDKDIVHKLGPSWFYSYKRQPIQKIRDYFGETIAMYFSFADFYTTALVVPTLLGFLQFIFSNVTTPYFCCFYVIWMTVFLEIWKRKSSELAYQWGTISMSNLDIPRPDYYGELGRDPITGKLTPQYPMWKTTLQIYCVTVPIMLCCLSFAIFLTVFQFWFEDYLISIFGIDSYIVLFPSILQSILVAVMAVVYDRFATYLTDKENHRTQNQFERHRVNKLIVLEFVNNFFCLFYIAFIKKDMIVLRNQLMTQMIILQFIQSASEFILPKLKQKYVLWFCCDPKVLKPELIETSSIVSYYDDLGIKDLDLDDPKIRQNVRESAKFEYNTYDDFLELYIQFGYVVLFSSVAPMAAFWALFNNLIEIKLDAYKLCKSYRRPFARRTKNIGAWQLAFEVLAVTSIMTNLGILYWSPEVQYFTEGLSTEYRIVLFVALEHVLLAMTWFIHKAIPDCPTWVRVEIAKGDYESRQALKREDRDLSELRKILKTN